MVFKSVLKVMAYTLSHVRTATELGDLTAERGGEIIVRDVIPWTAMRDGDRIV